MTRLTSEGTLRISVLIALTSASCLGVTSGGGGPQPDLSAIGDAGTMVDGAGGDQAGGLDATMGDAGGCTSNCDMASVQYDLSPIGPTLCGVPETERAREVCRRWTCDRSDLSEGTWSGSVATCSPGDMTTTARDTALRILNLYRFLAELPEVVTDSTRNQKAQECALMMDANNALDHTPPTNWTCYTADGAEAAGKSNISTGRAVYSVDAYIVDSGAGNAATIGHRRWILSNQLGPVGIGSTTGGSCLWVLGGSGTASRAWTAWPPPGPIPQAAIGGADTTGWTLQSDTINLGAAQVTITDGAITKPVTVTQLLANYGSDYAIRINPNGWTSQAGHTYHVSVTGISPTIAYDVWVVDCAP